MAEQSYPRMLYRGPADETAETQPVADAVAEAAALAEGWRLHRPLEPGAPAEAAPEAESPDADAPPPKSGSARRR